MAKIVGIKFKHTGKVYYFDPADVFYKKETGVIVETARGIEYGKVVIEPKDVPEEEIVQPLKPILRKATADDEERMRKNEAKVPSALKIANEKILARDLKITGEPLEILKQILKYSIIKLIFIYFIQCF